MCRQHTTTLQQGPYVIYAVLSTSLLALAAHTMWNSMEIFAFQRFRLGDKQANMVATSA